MIFEIYEESGLKPRARTLAYCGAWRMASPHPGVWVVLALMCCLAGSFRPSRSAAGLD